MLQGTVRGLVLLLGVLTLMGGLAAFPLGGPLAAFWTLAVGSVMIFAAFVQRGRYRSENAERTNAAPGAGGGELGLLEPRFLPTKEVFADPTTGRLMRVWVDPRSGERRYRAEG